MDPTCFNNFKAIIFGLLLREKITILLILISGPELCLWFEIDQ